MRCKTCGAELSFGVGISRVQDLNGGPVDFYCEPHSPYAGRGYTLADLQAMRNDRYAVPADAPYQEWPEGVGDG